MLGLSLHSWEDLMIFALVIVGASGVLVGVATFAVVRLQRTELATSRIEFDKYKLDTSKEISDANARAEEAKAKTAQAEERLARLSMPRGLFLSGVGCREALKGRPARMTVQIFWLRSVPDAEWLAHRIGTCLFLDDNDMPAQIVDKVEPIDALPQRVNTGITVIGRPSGAWWIEPKTPADFIMKALSAGMAGDPSGVTRDYEMNMPDDLVKIVIGPKL